MDAGDDTGQVRMSRNTKLGLMEEISGDGE